MGMDQDFYFNFIRICQPFKGTYSISSSMSFIFNSC